MSDMATRYNHPEVSAETATRIAESRAFWAEHALSANG